MSFTYWSSVFNGGNKSSSYRTGSIICTRSGDLPRRREQWKWERAGMRAGRAAGLRGGRLFPVPRRGMPAQATKPTRRHSPRSPPGSGLCSAHCSLLRHVIFQDFPPKWHSQLHESKRSIRYLEIVAFHLSVWKENASDLLAEFQKKYLKVSFI